MFERYTEKARRAIFFARYHASMSDSSYIETQHLLAGILHDDRPTLEMLMGKGPTQALGGLVKTDDPQPTKNESSHLTPNTPITVNLRKKAWVPDWIFRNLVDTEIRNDEKVRDLSWLIGELRTSRGGRLAVDLPLSNECKRVLAYAAEEAERLNHRHIGNEHLLLGRLREKDSMAARIVMKSGATLESIRMKAASSST